MLSRHISGVRTDVGRVFRRQLQGSSGRSEMQKQER